MALPDPLTLPEMILTIFAWIGIALLFTLIVGIAFGGFRIYMKTHHPNRLFLSEEAESLEERDLSLRLLRHYAASVRHQKYHGLDVVTVTVNQTG